eukprot:12534_1
MFLTFYLFIHLYCSLVHAMPELSFLDCSWLYVESNIDTDIRGIYARARDARDTSIKFQKRIPSSFSTSDYYLTVVNSSQMTWIISKIPKAWGSEQFVVNRSFDHKIIPHQDALYVRLILDHHQIIAIRNRTSFEAQSQLIKYRESLRTIAELQRENNASHAQLIRLQKNEEHNLNHTARLQRELMENKRLHAREIQMMNETLVQFRNDLHKTTIELRHMNSTAKRLELELETIAHVGMNSSTMQQVNHVLLVHEMIEKDNDIKLIGLSCFATTIILTLMLCLCNLCKQKTEIIQLAGVNERSCSNNNVPSVLNRYKQYNPNCIIKLHGTQKHMVQQIHWQQEELKQVVQNADAANSVLMEQVIEDMDNEGNETQNIS